MTFEQETNGVRIVVRPLYLPERSDPEEPAFAFAYTIRIENVGEATVQLLARRWRIMDENGLTQEVAGKGVVGVQPIIPPGAAFEYTSWASIATPRGVMVGSYEMTDLDARAAFEAAIPAFPLETPDAKGLAH